MAIIELRNSFYLSRYLPITHTYTEYYNTKLHFKPLHVTFIGLYYPLDQKNWVPSSFPSVVIIKKIFPTPIVLLFINRICTENNICTLFNFYGTFSSAVHGERKSAA